jgi:hypothetical protein
MDAKSLRRTLNGWEKVHGLQTDFDPQARANVTHARKRLSEAGHRMAEVLPDDLCDADFIHITLDARDLDAPTATAVEDYLRHLVDVLEAEEKANLLALPREVMPGARPVTWSEVRERIAELETTRAAFDRKRVVSGVIDRMQQRRDVEAELENHPHANEILSILERPVDAIAPRDAWGRWRIPLDLGSVSARLLAGEPRPRTRVRLRWDDARGKRDRWGYRQVGREHISDDDGRPVLLEQRTSGLRVGIPTGRR